MKYLITTEGTNTPFYTQWFEPEKHFNKDLGMVVYDLYEELYTTDGITWNEISVKHLLN